MSLDDQLADLWAAGATKPRPRDEAERALVLDRIAALWLGQSQRQIARKLSLNAGTVSGLIMRARRKGRRALSGPAGSDAEGQAAAEASPAQAAR